MIKWFLLWKGRQRPKIINLQKPFLTNIRDKGILLFCNVWLVGHKRIINEKECCARYSSPWQHPCSPHFKALSGEHEKMLWRRRLPIVASSSFSHMKTDATSKTSIKSILVFFGVHILLLSSFSNSKKHRKGSLLYNGSGKSWAWLWW